MSECAAVVYAGAAATPPTSQRMFRRWIDQHRNEDPLRATHLVWSVSIFAAGSFLTSAPFRQLRTTALAL